MKKEELQEWLDELQEATGDACYAEKRKNEIEALTQISVVIGKIRKYPRYNEETDRILDLLARPKKRFNDELADAIDELIVEMNEDIEKLEEIEEVAAAFKESYEEIKNATKSAIDEAAEKAKDVAEKAKNGAKGLEKKARTALRNWIMKED